MTQKGFMIGIMMAAAAVTATSALAAGPDFGRHARGPAAAVMSFEELDADGNGEISREEITNRAEARFAAADTNGDGLLSQDEMVAAAQARVEGRVTRMIAHLDKDGDGAVSLEELPTRGKRGGPDRDAMLFGAIDSDGDGVVSEEEYAAMQDFMKKYRFMKTGERMGEMRHGRDDHGRDHGPRHEREQRPAPQTTPDQPQD